MEEQELADHVAEMVAAQVAQQLQLLGMQGNVAAAAQHSSCRDREVAILLAGRS